MRPSDNQLPPMFTNHDPERNKLHRFAMIGLALLSATALAITVWIMFDFRNEQTIVEDLTNQLPPSAQDSVAYLAGELQWQSRLIILVVINLVATAITGALLWRAYHASQASLMDMQSLAKNIIGSMEQAVMTTDIQGNLTSINRRALEVFDATLEDVEQPIETTSALGHLGKFRRQWLDGHQKQAHKEFVVESQGLQRTLRASCQTLRNREGKEMGNVMQVRDITEQRLIEDRTRRMERYMGLGALAGGLHHEIKNPLAALSLHVQLLEEELADAGSSGDVHSMLGVIQSEVKRIGGVLESFRDFASIDQLDLYDIDLNKMVERQVKLMQPKADTQQVNLVTDLASRDLFVRADEVRLEQVLLNLIINALEVMPKSGKLTIVTGELEGAAYIEVHDTGPGIPESLQNKILDPYFTTKTSGTGLGLAFCDKIIRQHAGSLEFETSGSGSVFRLTVPIEESS